MTIPLNTPNPSPGSRWRKLAACAGMLMAAGLGLLHGAPQASAAEPAKKPNILLIVADDMGYSDVGAFGGEIETPNIDALAQRGLSATNFYVAPTCSPTRSMLLTGTDNHVAGFGVMSEYTGPQQKGKPGYEGHLNQRVTSIATLLRDSGYHTYMAGKWHLGEEKGQWPADQGFERDFTLMQGGGSHWSDMGYPNPQHPNLTFTRNGKLLDKLPDDHFSTAAFSDFITQSIDENKADGKPFFAYLSYQAVHSPFALPDDWIDKYKGRYDQGYDALRAERLARMKAMGLVGADVSLAPRMPNVPAWDSLTPEQKKISARKMEVYAAMVANMDHHIGRVLGHLKANGQLDNTLVLFFSDNGAEPVELLELAASVDPAMKVWLEKNWDTKPENCGRKMSVCDYGAAWAQVGSTPFNYFKHYTAEGGIRSPLIAAGPGVVSDGQTTRAVPARDRCRTDTPRTCRRQPPVAARRKRSGTADRQVDAACPRRQGAGHPQRRRMDRLGAVRQPRPAPGRLEGPVPAEGSRRHRRMAAVQPEGRPDGVTRPGVQPAGQARGADPAVGPLCQPERRHSHR
jgi:arylsulfatase A-like enzyme